MNATPDPTAPPPTRRSGIRRTIGWVLRLWPFWVLPMLAVLYTGWSRSGAGGAAGEGLAGAVSPAAAAGVKADGTFRVGIYNIQGAIGKREAGTWDAIAAELADVDLCGLTEVRGNSWSADNRSQAQMLGERMGYAWLFAPAERRFWRDSNGNGVVSRLPVTSWVRLPLPATGEAGSFRNATLLRTTVGGETVQIVVAHLDRGPSRPAQLQALTQLFAGLQPPAVLLADLNADPFDPLLRPLLNIPGTADVISDRFGAKEKRVDWILVRGLTCDHVGRVDTASSDHAYFWADLRVPSSTTRPAP